MRKENVNPIESYIAKLDSIEEGTRNDTLYKIGIHLRRRFGLEGAELLLQLCAINRAKCRSPLDDEEVETIAGSVDRSNAPLGSPANAGTVDIDSIPRPVSEYLSKEISIFPSATDSTPIGTLTIGQFLDNVRNGKYKEICEAIQAEPDKERRNALKKRLPCVTIQSIPCERRKREHCKNNAIVCIDIDGVENIDVVRRVLAALPYVFAVVISASGRGVFALVALAEPAENLEQVLEEIQQDIAYTIDMTGKNVSRLRYVSFDPDLIVKDTVIPWNAKRKAAPDIVLDPDTPLPSADKFVETTYAFDGIPTLIFYAGDYWQWMGNAYRKIESGEVKRKLLHFLERTKVAYRRKDDNSLFYVPFPVVPGTLNSITEMLKSRIFRPVSDSIPCWMGDESCEMLSSVADTSSLIFGKNTILNLADMGILPHTPYWFNTAALDFDYDSHAECPQWNTFRNSIFGDDEESKQTLMEWMGLCLTPITKFHKALFLIGPKRSGKGTIGRILQKVVGIHSTVSPSTQAFGQNFGLQPLIGKTSAVVYDARFERGASRIIERVLNITGEDMLTIDRKNREALTLRLQTKLMFISNEVPNVIDQSGAFASRFIFLKLPQSFYGREDVELEVKLSRELPGILRLAIQHLQVLLERGRFIQPETGKRLAERMTALSSPVGEFMKQLLPSMSKEDIWKQWADFCIAEGEGLGKQGDLWNNLESAGYNCDFAVADILAKIQEHGGESTVRKLQDGIAEYHKDGGAERLRRKLAEIVDAGLLTVRVAKAGNGHPVEYYRIPGVKIGDAYDDYT